VQSQWRNEGGFPQMLKPNQSPIRGFRWCGTASNLSEVFWMGVSQLSYVFVLERHTQLYRAPSPSHIGY